MAAARTSADTPLMRQYLDVKARYPDAIVFFRLGDFYEMFFDDAVWVAKALDLTLTTRDRGKEDPIPMCGIPHHSARGYLARLLEMGRRIALCEQLEDPRLSKGIVKRDVVRIVTPGVVLDEDVLDARVPSFVAAVAGDRRRGFGLAFLDVTTGDFRATEASTLEGLVDEVARADPREILIRGGDEEGGDDGEVASTLRRAYPRLAQTAAPEDDGGKPAAALAAALGAGFDATIADRLPVAALAASRVLAYARSTQPGATLPLARLDVFRRADYLVLDEQARAHLELTETLMDRKRRGSLLDVVDETRTAMGGRLLRRWLLFPLCEVAPIRRRHDAVERLCVAQSARDGTRTILGGMADIERLVGRARLGVATPRDLAALGATIERLPDLAKALGAAHAGEIGDRAGGAGGGDDLLDLGRDLAQPLGARIVRTIRDDAPALTKDGGFVRPGVSAELDELASIGAGGRDRIAAIEARERERTGIGSLKVKYNSVFGYYIEVTRAQLASVPADYVRKQTVANAERFVTPELADHEARILSADERRIALETQIFTALRDEVAGEAGSLLALGARVAAADALAGLAEVAHRSGYCRPVVDESAVIEITDGRHPVVERFAAAGGFVPNDVRLDPEAEQVLIVTGPNMAGKSTLIRQVALTVIMAQMGGFVPARSARIGLCDRVFTRVGAGDNLARGESTFLVEMRETAHILRNATARSLIVLDEIGRGTSTYDGVSIAWAVAEHIHDRVRARTLFATHYHELTALGDLHPRVRNACVTAREWKGEVVFLRKLVAGGTSRSFGIEVARLAGLPDAVVERARALLRSLEAEAAVPGGPRRVDPTVLPVQQLGLFVPHTPTAAEEVAAALRAVDPDDLSPREALDLVSALRTKLGPSS